MWTEADGCRLDGSDGKPRASIERLVNLYDELQENISKSIDRQTTSSTPSQKSSLELICSEFHHLNVPTNGERTQHTTNTTETIRNIVQLETDLYRAMWLNCLILLSMINALNTKHGSRKRSRKEMNNPTSDDGNKTILLQRSIDQCRLLVGLLDTLAGDAESNTDNPWEEQIRKWTGDSNDDENDEEDEDHSLNILSFTKEQLEKEEQELLNMAETPIPTNHTYNQQQQQQEKGVPSNQKPRCSETLTEVQQEIQQLWPADAIVAAHTKARELFVQKDSEKLRNS